MIFVRAVPIAGRKRKSQKLIDAAKRNPFQNNLYQSHILTMEMYIKVLLEYQEAPIQLGKRDRCFGKRN